MELKLSYKRLSQYSKNELWNYLFNLIGSDRMHNEVATHPTEISKARLIDLIRMVCFDCHKWLEEPVVNRTEPQCDKCRESKLDKPM